MKCIAADAMYNKITEVSNLVLGVVSGYVVGLSLFMAIMYLISKLFGTTALSNVVLQIYFTFMISGMITVGFFISFLVGVLTYKLTTGLIKVKNT